MRAGSSRTTLGSMEDGLLTPGCTAQMHRCMAMVTGAIYGEAASEAEEGRGEQLDEEVRPTHHVLLQRRPEHTPLRLRISPLHVLRRCRRCTSSCARANRARPASLTGLDDHHYNVAISSPTAGRARARVGRSRGGSAAARRRAGDLRALGRRRQPVEGAHAD